MSARRSVNANQMMAAMMEERDEKSSSSENSGKAYQNDGEIAVVQTKNENSFNELGQSYRSGLKVVNV
jgi:hypothetical protein